MARIMSEMEIQLGSGPRVGKFSLNPRDVKGAGGWRNPYLYIPINVQIYPTQRAEEQIALINLTASLHLRESIDPTNYFASSINLNFINNLPHRSILGTAPTSSILYLHFNLTHEQIAQLDEFRRDTGASLYVQLEPTLVRLINEDTAYLTLGNKQISIGQAAIFSHLWVAGVGSLRIDLAEVKWQEEVFPQIGYDQYRLVEVGMPVSSSLVPPKAIDAYKKALMEYDHQNNSECLAQCRFALDWVEKRLKVQRHELGTAITKELGWSAQPALTDQAQYLNASWLGLYILANAAHHVPSTQSLLPSDAHAVLLNLAVMLEYLVHLQ
jgi:hypothetical protein